MKFASLLIVTPVSFHQGYCHLVAPFTLAIYKDMEENTLFLFAQIVATVILPLDFVFYTSTLHHGKKYGIHHYKNPWLIFENAAFCLNSLAFSGRKIHYFSVIFLSVNLSIRSIIR